MNDDSTKPLLVSTRAFRCISLLAAAVAVMSGCGDGVQPVPSEDVRTLASVTADHGLDPGNRITVESGMVEDHGNVTIHCPAGTPDCEIVVAADGSVGYAADGGVPVIVPRSPTPVPVEDLLRHRLLESTWPVAFSFGGGVATCEAIGCPVTDAIHVDRHAAGGGRHPSDGHRPDLSGFAPLDPRREIGLARKAQIVAEGGRSAVHRAFGAWMDHGFFLVETFTMPGDAGSRYHTTWFGDAAHTGPLTAPSGSATWSSVMSGVESAPLSGSGAFVHGDSAITVSGLATGASVDVAFTNIVNEDTGAVIDDMVWRGLPLQGREFGADSVRFNDGDGYFRSERFGAAAEGTLYGRLYGPGHEEVGGLFHRNGISGAFAGKRDQ
ncbi:MAG: hypothetical protein F4103_04070 [Boseongicola sp. SB0673_bin_14]|nr:hypothetical protein [Boseongicola sp. SB0667_bin_21]MYI67954.1 hypothetical protein [Boseongicola sp. SB0673_bin_14]